MFLDDIPKKFRVIIQSIFKFGFIELFDGTNRRFFGNGRPYVAARYITVSFYLSGFKRTYKHQFEGLTE